MYLFIIQKMDEMDKMNEMNENLNDWKCGDSEIEEKKTLEESEEDEE